MLSGLIGRNPESVMTEMGKITVTSPFGNPGPSSSKAIVIQPTDLTYSPKNRKRVGDFNLQPWDKTDLVNEPRSDRILELLEPVQAFKCKLCNHLSLEMGQAEQHLIREHEDEYFYHFSSQDWLDIAFKEDIRLDCPRCDNNFRSEGSRSFKVHMMDDHQDSKAVAEAFFEQQNDMRRRRVLRFLRDQREAQKIKKTAFQSKPMEAYVDVKGQLRVRSAADGRDQIDVSADKYFSVVSSDPDKDILVTNDLPRTKTTSKTESFAKKGRKKGSKSIGLSKLKSLNSNITMSEEVLGENLTLRRCRSCRSRFGRWDCKAVARFGLYLLLSCCSGVSLNASRLYDDALTLCNQGNLREGLWTDCTYSNGSDKNYFRAIIFSKVFKVLCNYFSNH